MNSKIGSSTIPSALGQTITGALANIPFPFGIDSQGNYGYKKVGADTVTPFKSGALSNVVFAWAVFDSTPYRQDSSTRWIVGGSPFTLTPGTYTFHARNMHTDHWTTSGVANWSGAHWIVGSTTLNQDATYTVEVQTTASFEFYSVRSDYHLPYAIVTKDS